METKISPKGSRLLVSNGKYDSHIANIVNALKLDKPENPEKVSYDLKSTSVKKKGRPRKQIETKNLTLSLNQDLLRKIKLIAVYDDVSITSIVEEALWTKIKKWENANHKDLN